MAWVSLGDWGGVVNMDDLVKRLRDWMEDDQGKINDTRDEAADRIEQLERELAEQVNKKVGYYNDWLAEKALADQLAQDLECYRAEIDPDCKDHCCQYARETEVVLAAYRKARGL